MLTKFRKIMVLLFVFLLMELILSACQQKTVTPPNATEIISQTLTASSTFSPSETASQTPSLTNTITPSETPSKTPRPATVTPTLTYTSTSFPTFYPQNVVTHTPAPPAQCPEEDPDLVIKIDDEAFWNEYGNRLKFIQQMLDEGATLRQVSDTVDRIIGDYTNREVNVYPLLDLNGDGVDELVVDLYLTLYAISCDKGDYKIILDYYTDDGGRGDVEIITIEDMNLNGTPEVVLVYSITSGGNLVADILEWNGSEFVSLLRADFGEDAEQTNSFVRVLYWYDLHRWWSTLPVMNGWGEVEITDTDWNGTKELILTDDGPSHWDTVISFGPWRGQKKVFDWNGLFFQYSVLELMPPEYLYQAVNEADRQFLLGNYERALKLYQDVVFSDRLDFWSEERQQYNMNANIAKLNDELMPTLPAPDPNEYASLSAYARYRILLHHLTLGWMQDASVVNDNLQAKHPVGTAGHPYAEMATLLWQKYQDTEDLSLACQPVLTYIEEHPEILDPLGNSTYHGLQVHRYIPQDICPFGVEFE